MIYLIDNGANLDFLNKQGLAPLHIAAKEGYVEVVNRLIIDRAKVDLKDKNGFTPLFWAVQNKQLSVVEALMNAGADCNYSAPMSINELQGLVVNESSQVKERMAKFIKRKSSLGALPISISSCELALILAHRKIIEAVISSNLTPTNQLFKLIALSSPVGRNSFLYQTLPPLMSGKRKKPEAKKIPTEEQRRNVMS